MVMSCRPCFAAVLHIWIAALLAASLPFHATALNQISAVIGDHASFWQYPSDDGSSSTQVRREEPMHGSGLDGDVLVQTKQEAHATSQSTAAVGMRARLFTKQWTVGSLFGVSFGGTMFIGLLIFWFISQRRKGHFSWSPFSSNYDDARSFREHSYYQGPAHAHYDQGYAEGKGFAGKGHLASGAGGFAEGGKPSGAYGKPGGKPAGKQGAAKGMLPAGGKPGSAKGMPAQSGGKGMPANPAGKQSGKGLAPAAPIETPQAAKAAPKPPAPKEELNKEPEVTEEVEVAPVEVPTTGPRPPTENMRMVLMVEAKNGKKMPSVNTFGGCDPFVEVRCVQGDPNKKKGALEDVAKDKAQTQAKSGELNPTWNESMTLSTAFYGQDYFINIILWDAGLTSNTPLGYHAVDTKTLLDGMNFDPGAEQANRKEYTASNFNTLLSEKLNASINLSFSYIEIHTFKVCVKKGSHLPRVDTLGSIDAFVDVRVVDRDPRKLEYATSPGPETQWSGQTKIVNDNMDPTFNQDFTFSLPARPEWYLILCLTDSGTLINTPCGMVVVPMKDICCNQNGAEQQFRSKLEKLANWPAPDNLSKATLSFTVSHDVATGEK